MTTAHRPTFDPARGKESQRGPAYHQRLLAAHTHLKQRQAGQGGAADDDAQRDLRAELLRAEAKVRARKRAAAGEEAEDDESLDGDSRDAKRLKGAEMLEEAEGEEERRRARILEDARDADADSAGSGSEGGSSSSEDDDDDDDDDDEEAELMRELAKVKAERAAAKAEEEAERAKKEEEQREKDIARGNPLLNRDREEYKVKRPWDEDVVFKNQARGVEERQKASGKEFVNDMLRSDFHKRFMSKYVR